MSSCGACFLYIKWVTGLGLNAHAPVPKTFFGLDIGSTMPLPSCKNLFVELPSPRVLGPAGAQGSGDDIDHVHYTSRWKNQREVTDPQSVSLSVTLR